MANELRLAASLKFDKGDEHLDEIFDAILSVTGTKKAALTQTVGTSEEAVLKGDVGTPGYILILNKDLTNYITIRGATAQTDCVKVRARGIALFEFAGSAPYWIANTAPCEIKYALIEA